MNKLGIDVSTDHAKKLINRLAKLKSTLTVEHGGIYHADEQYSQIHIETTMTESELDDWLWKTKHDCDYVGVFSLGETK